MKKVFSVLLMLVLICTAGFATAEGLDYSSMSDEELHATISSARNELTRRELIAEEKLVIFEADNVQAYLTGNYEVYGSDTVFLNLEAVIINDSDATVSLMTEACCINGWDVWSMGIANTSAGKKHKGNFNIKLTDAEIATFEEIEEIEFTFYLSNAETYKRIGESTSVVVHYNVE